jgi:hypothetical protein
MFGEQRRSQDFEVGGQHGERGARGYMGFGGGSPSGVQLGAEPLVRRASLPEAGDVLYFN